MLSWSTFRNSLHEKLLKVQESVTFHLVIHKFVSTFNLLTSKVNVYQTDYKQDKQLHTYHEDSKYLPHDEELEHRLCHQNAKAPDKRAYNSAAIGQLVSLRIVFVYWENNR